MSLIHKYEVVKTVLNSHDFRCQNHAYSFYIFHKSSVALDIQEIHYFIFWFKSFSLLLISDVMHIENFYWKIFQMQDKHLSHFITKYSNYFEEYSINSIFRYIYVWKNISWRIHGPKIIDWKWLIGLQRNIRLQLI